MSTYIRYLYSGVDSPDRVQENTILRKFYSIKSHKIDPDKEGLPIKMEQLYAYIREGHPEARNICIIQTFDKDTRSALGVGSIGSSKEWRRGMETALKRGRNTGDFD